jgi:glycosyltransferase involved in cell wall biosynthesis
MDRQVKSPLRILHVGKFYPPSRGGMEMVVQVLCEAERAVVGLDSRVLVANEGAATVHESVRGVPVTRVGCWRRIGAVALCPTFPYWMRRVQCDVMVIHEPNPVALVAHALVHPRAKLVFWVHAEVVRPQWRYRTFYRPFLRRALRLADRIVVASPPVREHARELQDFRDKCVVIPYALDPDRGAQTEETRARVREIRAERDEPLVLFVGRMVPYKGVDVLLRALVGTKARLILVGDGPLRATWQQLALELGLGARGRFTGEASPAELTALYQACDMFVLPSVTRAEAFGIVQLEAMAHRKPVISTRLESGVPWVNQDGVTGLVVPAGDPTALRHAMNRLAADPELRRRMGEQGLARVTADFSTARMVEQTTTLYRELVETPIPKRDAQLAASAGAR